MSHPYRTPSAPSRSHLVIELRALPPHRELHTNVLVAPGAALVMYATGLVVDALAGGSGLWPGALLLGVGVALVLLALRFDASGTLSISEEGLKQAGVLRDRVVRWDALVGVRRFAQRVGEREVACIGVGDGRRELLVNEAEILDPAGTLDRVLAAAEARRPHEIRARVRAEGRAPTNARRWALGIVALLLATGWIIHTCCGRGPWEFGGDLHHKLPSAGRSPLLDLLVPRP